MKTTWIRFVDARRTRSVFLAVRVVRGISKLRDGAMCRKGGERVIPHTIGLLYNECYIKIRKSIERLSRVPLLLVTLVRDVS